MKPIFLAMIFSLGVSISAFGNTSCNSFYSGIHVVGQLQDKILWGDQTSFSVKGLEPNKLYQVTLYFKSKLGLEKASIKARASELGEINTATVESLSGSYLGVSSNGLFWSRKLVETATNISIPEGSFRLVVETETEKIKYQKDFEHKFLKSDVATKDIGLESGFIGKWFVPKAPSSKVIVVTLSGSEGGIYTSLATSAILANHGITSLAVAYFGMLGLPKELDRIPLEYFERIFQHIKLSSPFADSKIVVLGGSRGGELSLLLGALFPVVQGVVAIAPSPYIWGANKSDPNWSSAWTLNGQEVPYLRTVGDLVEVQDYDGTKSLANRPAFEKALDLVSPNFRPRSLVERTNGPVLMIAGSEDQIWPSARLVNETNSILKSNPRMFKDESVFFQGAGHDFLAPTSATVSRSFEHPHMGVRLALGGSPKPSGTANLKAWEKIFEFLKGI